MLKQRTAEARSVSRDRALLERHLAKCEATDRAVAALEAQVSSLPSAVAALEAQIARSRQSEQENRTLGDERGARTERAVRAGLAEDLRRTRAQRTRRTAALGKKRTARDTEPLRAYGAKGILNLSKTAVEAPTGAGPRWGGNWKGAKDFMHFDI